MHFHFQLLIVYKFPLHMFRSIHRSSLICKLLKVESESKFSWLIDSELKMHGESHIKNEIKDSNLKFVLWTSTFEAERNPGPFH